MERKELQNKRQLQNHRYPKLQHNDHKSLVEEERKMLLVLAIKYCAEFAIREHFDLSPATIVSPKR